MLEITPILAKCFDKILHFAIASFRITKLRFVVIVKYLLYQTSPTYLYLPQARTLAVAWEYDILILNICLNSINYIYFFFYINLHIFRNKNKFSININEPGIKTNKIIPPQAG